MKGILVLLVLGMLVFGCTYSGSANYSAGANVSAGNDTAKPAPSNPPVNASGSETRPAGEPSPPPSGELSGKNYSDLILAGKPSQCTLDFMDAADAKISMKLYFDGKGAMRMEQPDTGFANCPSAAIVFKGDSAGNGIMYVSCPGDDDALGTEFGTHEKCDWQSMEIESDFGGIGSASRGIEGGYNTPMINYAVDPVYDCKSWTMDSSKFQVPGKVCN
ncbi:MAG TPA: hypothetical protein VLD37_02910 [Candidatus Bilamarchaeum sp.]|nr:hypothetical protein [Candidatus Bilamarchaeum sp.]